MVYYYIDGRVYRKEFVYNGYGRILEKTLVEVLQN